MKTIYLNANIELTVQCPDGAIPQDIAHLVEKNGTYVVRYADLPEVVTDPKRRVTITAVNWKSTDYPTEDGVEFFNTRDDY